ncbi:alpha/beta fold hydrolase [Chondromyces crocatus]|uniref:Alpha/beta hydrolase n=1 Tax=Chondromyces crocatus TaxID=52 RepID=A0A0K1E6Z9_CHOCO|nr:alpha/beta fold hydrolase [Chondromyces crocatus]AKT36353.1 alpha/beta hydrolase [Chondromyces crocatus]
MSNVYAVVSRPGPVEERLLDELAASTQPFSVMRRGAAGIALRYLDAGSGPPLVLLHGRGHAATSWLPLLPALARHRRVIAVDLPGFGHSAWRPFPASARAGASRPPTSAPAPLIPGGDGDDLVARALDFFVDPVEALLCDLGLSEAPLVGHSLGGLCALAITLRRRARPRWLALIGAMGVGPEMSALGRAYFLLGPERAAGRASIALFQRFGAPTETSCTARLGALHAELASVPDGRRDAATAFRVLAPLRGPVPHLRERLGEIETDTLLLWGERDELLPAPLAIGAAARMPRATLKLLPRGHAPHHEAPEETLRHLAPLLDRS